MRPIDESDQTMTGIRSILFAAAAAGSLCAATASQAGTSFDGRWTVRVATNQACEAGYAVSLRVQNGRISYGGLFGAVASGKVTDSGNLTVRVSSMSDVVRASGALGDQSGSGSWKSPTCAGTWTARKA